MTQILRTISDPSWWVSVFFAGVFINLLSAYLKPWIDKKIARYSITRQQALETKNSKRAELVAKMSTEMALIIEAKLDMLNLALKAIVFLAMAVIMLIVFQDIRLSLGFLLIKYAAVLILFVLSIYGMGLAGRTESLIQDAKKRRAVQNSGRQDLNQGTV